MALNMITSKINPLDNASQFLPLNQLYDKVASYVANKLTRRAALLVTLLCAVGSANMVAPAQGALAEGNGIQTEHTGPENQPTLRTVSAAPIQKASVAVPTDRVYNVTQDTSFSDLQPAINAANPGDVITASAGLYTGSLNQITIPLAKQPLTIMGAGQGSTIISGTTTGNGVTLPDNTNGVTLTQLTIRNFETGIFGPASGGTLSNVVIDAVDSISNTGPSNAGRGFFSQAFGTTNITIRNSNFSYNSNRGLWIINGAHNGITVTNSIFRNNGTFSSVTRAGTGIDISDGSASGVYVVSNTVVGNIDNGIGILGLTSGAGPNLVAGNVLTDNGRFGIEIKVPNGTGTETGDGSIVVRDNQVAQTAPPADLRDLAGIAVVRRAKGAGNVDVPNGVIVRNNTVTGYVQPEAGGHEGYGIVVEGTSMRVVSNTLINNEIALQMQETISPTRNYPGDSLTGGPGAPLAAPEPNNTYFDRGNAPNTCAFFSNNTLTGNTTNFRVVGPGRHRQRHQHKHQRGVLLHPGRHR